MLYEIGWALKSQEKHAEAAAPFARLAAEHAQSPLAAEASFHVGEDHYEKKEYAEAAKLYTAAKAKATSRRIGREGNYKLGWSHFQLKQYDEALKQFSEQLAAHGQGPLAADATFMKAECLFRLEKYQGGLARVSGGSQDQGQLAGIRRADAAARRADGIAAQAVGRGSELLAEIPAKYPETPLLAEALYEIALGQAELRQNRTRPCRTTKPPQPNRAITSGPGPAS